MPLRRPATLLLALLLAAVTAAVAAPRPAHADSSSRLLRVPTDFPTITAAVAAAKPGDYILIGPGTYHEAINVTKPRLTIAGVDRNRVILDGQHKLQDAIKVEGADDVTIENMTAMNYQENGFWWDNVTGYHGAYLTAENLGEYGIYAFNSVMGLFDHSYASGGGDSGFYIGQCYDCKALITQVHSAYNSLGYSGTNAGGVIIRDSEFDNNMAGIAPNTLTSENDYPQGSQAGDLIYNNDVHDNNNNNAPATFAIGPLNPIIGVGIELAGGWNNQVVHNHVHDQKHWGIAVHYLITPTQNNKVIANTIERATDADLSYDGNGAQNCWANNSDPGTSDGAATSDPQLLQTANGCHVGPAGLQGAPVGGDPTNGLLVALNAAGVTEPRSPNPNQPLGGPQASLSQRDVCAGAPAGCEGSAAAVAAGPPTVVQASSSTTVIQQGSAVPASITQVAAGLAAKPTHEEVQASLQAALAHLHQPTTVVTVPGQILPADADIRGYVAIALLTLGVLLTGLAVMGWALRRPRPA